MTIHEQNTVSISRACRQFGLSRSGYCLWLRRKPQPNVEEMTLRAVIQDIALEYSCYGYRRITAELRNRGITVNRKRVLRLMQADNLLCARKVFKPQTTDSNHGLRVYQNLAKGLVVTEVNRLWVADITYIRLEREFVYLAVVIDIYSRRCLGWALSRIIDTQLTRDALDQALRCRQGMDLSGLLHHSDQGVQYASKDYIERLIEYGIQPSMSRRGNPYDNAFAESFMKTLKHEEVNLQDYEDYDDAHQNIGTFIEEVYNAKRLHSSIGYTTPNEYEKHANINAQVA
jgi:transposase InsO family protein